jgi:hypothetical protein
LRSSWRRSLAQDELLVGQLAAQAVALRAQVRVLALGVERVPDPGEQVADRLQRAAGPVLDRGDDLEDAALDRAHAARPAEGGGQEDDGADDEQCEHRPSSADRLVVHVEGYPEG